MYHNAAVGVAIQCWSSIYRYAWLGVILCSSNNRCSANRTSDDKMG